MVSRPITDKESNKFDSEDRVKVSIEADNTTATERNVKVTNDSSESIPVTITNTDTSVDLEVNIAENVTIDTTTPLDVNVTNSSVDTNATIQGTPNVAVTNDVSIDDATAVRVDVTNTSLATNATIQNPYIVTYPEVYNGAAWYERSGDSDGRAINKDQKYYSSADITALGSSTSTTIWTTALADGILTYSHVGQWQNEFAEVIYHTHPDLGDNNKCLKEILIYTTQNNATVIESRTYSVVDWTFDNAVYGSVSISNGTITSPDPNSAISQGVDVCTLSITDNTFGPITIELSGASASLYQLNDGTTVGSTLTYDATKSYLLECASDFSGSTYSHSVTVTVTGTDFNISNSINIATTGTFVATGAFLNQKAFKVNGSLLMFTEDTAAGTAASDSVNKGPWEGMGFLRTGGNQDRIGIPNYDDSWSASMWLKIPTITTNNFISILNYWDHIQTNLRMGITLWVRSSAGNFRIYGTVGENASGLINVGHGNADVSPTFTANTFHHFAFVRDATAGNFKMYFNNTLLYTDTYSGTDTGNGNYTKLWASTASTVSDFHAFPVSASSSADDTHVDEFSTFNVALPATGSQSVESIYNSGANNQVTSYSGLVGYWRFGDGENSSAVADSTSNINDMSSNSNDMKVSAISASTPTIENIGSSEPIFQGPVFDNTKSIAGPNNHASTGSATSGAYMEVGKGLISNQTYLEDLSSNPKTVSFWLKAPQIANGKEVNLFGETSGWRTKGAHIAHRSTGYNKLYIFNMDTGSTYSQGAVAAAVIPVDTWVFISIVYDTSVSGSHCYINSSSTFSNTAHAFDSNTASPTNAFVSGSSLTISTAFFLGARSLYNNVYPSSSGASNYDSSSVIEIDEFTVFNKELTVTEVEELYNSFETLDATTHSAASDLFRYIRFGDGSDDTESVIKCAIDPNFELDKDSGATSTYQHTLTSLDDPYDP